MQMFLLPRRARFRRRPLRLRLLPSRRQILSLRQQLSPPPQRQQDLILQLLVSTHLSLTAAVHGLSIGNG
jgi:hypothetical protein